MLILNGDDVRAVLTMEDCIAAMSDALRGLSTGTFWQPPRSQIRYSGSSSLMGLMPAFRGGDNPLWGLKHILVAPANPARGLDAHQGVVLLNCADTGRLIAAVDATAITAVRTAAVSAVATKALARPDASTIAIIGAGHQARSHVEAMRIVLPDCRIVVASRSTQRAQAFADDVGIEAATSIEAAVTGADVVCTVTTSRDPVLRRAWINPGTHINAVGTSDPHAREIDGELLAASMFVVDSVAQAEIECGEYLLARAEGTLSAELHPIELGQILAGRGAARPDPEAITLFKSLGLAVEDLAAAELAVQRARHNNVGLEVAW